MRTLKRVAGVATAAVLLGALLATTVSLQPTAAAVQPLRPLCPIGDWEMTNLDSYMRALLDGDRPRVISVSGSMHLHFQGDGRFTQRTPGIIVETRTSAGSSDILVVAVYGEVIAEFSSGAADELVFNLIDSQGRVEMLLNGEPLLTDTTLDTSLLVGSGETHVPFACSSDQLVLNFAGVPSPMIFARIP